MTYEEFRGALDALCPVHRAKAIVGAIEALPVGTRIGSYVREPGKNRWRHEYTSIHYRRDRTRYMAQHASHTQAWSLALDFALPASHRGKDAELIAEAAYRVMVANGVTAVPHVSSKEPPASFFIPVDQKAAPIPPRASVPIRPGQQLALPL